MYPLAMGRCPMWYSGSSPLLTAPKMTKCKECKCEVPSETTKRGRHVREYYSCDCGHIGNHKVDLIPNVRRK